MTIKHLDCKLHQDQKAHQVCAELKELLGSSFFFTNLDKSILYTKLLKNNQGQIFQVVQVKKELPSTLVVYLKKEQPIYQLIYQDKSYWVNSQHYFGQSDPSLDLPIVEIKSTRQPVLKDQQVNPELNKQIIELIDQLSLSAIDIKKIILDQENSKLIVFADTPFIFEFGQNPAKLSYQVKTVVDQLPQINQELSSPMTQIDFRFNLPVVKTAQSEQQVFIEPKPEPSPPDSTLPNSTTPNSTSSPSADQLYIN